MYLVRVVPGNEELQKSTLSSGMMNLVAAVLTHRISDSKEFAKRCCQAGLCPLVLRQRLSK
ncbi:hypothetical protein D3C87_124280 [compost metagenome]